MKIDDDLKVLMGGSIVCPHAEIIPAWNQGFLLEAGNFYLLLESKRNLRQIQVKPGISNARVFLPENYYYPLTFTKISDNPKLVENPGY